MFSFIDGYDVQETRRVSEKKGKLAGMRAGEKKGKREVARKLKGEGLDVDLIAKATGLTNKAIEKL